MTKCTGPIGEVNSELLSKSVIYSKRTLKKSGGDNFVRNARAVILKPKRRNKKSKK